MQRSQLHAKTKLNLRAALSPDHLAEPDDILDAKKALMTLGYYATSKAMRPVPGSTTTSSPASSNSSAIMTSKWMP